MARRKIRAKSRRRRPAAKRKHRVPVRRAPQIDPRYARFALRIGHSRIHRRGVFAAETIPARRLVIEYTGERISQRETVRRYRVMLRRKFGGRSYFFELNRRWVIDGAVGGCGAELINHSCDPNLRQRIVRGHILLYSGRQIKRGEELAYDYKFDAEARTIPCSCGSPKCRGTINMGKKTK
jgi:uncharacterized protein